MPNTLGELASPLINLAEAESAKKVQYLLILLFQRQSIHPEN